MEGGPFTLPEVARAVGLQYRTAHMWVGRGILQPTVRVSGGSGRPNLFSAEDLERARTATMLYAAGLSPAKLELLAPRLGEHQHWRRVADLLG